MIKEESAYTIYRRFPVIVKVIAFILVITFITQDIVWAYPDPFAGTKRNAKDTLAPWPTFKDPPEESVDKLHIALICTEIEKTRERLGLSPEKFRLESVKAVLDRYKKEKWFSYSESEGEILISFSNGHRLRYYYPDISDRNKYALTVAAEGPMPKNGGLHLQYFRAKTPAPEKDDDAVRRSPVTAPAYDVFLDIPINGKRNSILRIRKDILEGMDKRDRADMEAIIAADGEGLSRLVAASNGRISYALGTRGTEGRTVYFRLREPITVNNKVLKLLKLKGVTPQTFGNSVIPYLGLNRAIRLWDTDKEGRINIRTAWESSAGGTMEMIEVDTERETMEDCPGSLVQTDEFLGDGTYSDLNFEKGKVGYLISGIEDEDIRLWSGDGKIEAVVYSGESDNVVGSGESFEAELPGIYAELGRQLREFHDKGYCHRYLSPGNIGLVREEGLWQIRLRDLSSVEKIGRMAPRQAAGYRLADICDIISDLGVAHIDWGRAGLFDNLIRYFLAGYFYDLSPDGKEIEEVMARKDDIIKGIMLLRFSKNGMELSEENEYFGKLMRSLYEIENIKRSQAELLGPMFGRHKFESTPDLRNLSDAEYWKIQESLMEARMLPPAYYEAASKERLTDITESLLPDHGAVLDLMSSAESNCRRAKDRRVVGIGIADEAMETNPVLDEIIIQDLNKEPNISYDGQAGAALITAGVMYLTYPIQVLSSIRRHLAQDGRLIITFSEQNYDSVMSVNVWNYPQAYGFTSRAEIVQHYLREAGWAGPIEVIREGDYVIICVTAADEVDCQIGARAYAVKKTLRLSEDGDFGIVDVGAKESKDTRIGTLNLRLEDDDAVVKTEKALLGHDYKDDKYRAIVSGIISHFRRSPPRVYVYGNLVRDLFGFASRKENLIALHYSIRDNPVAIFHEMGHMMLDERNLSDAPALGIALIKDDEGDSRRYVKLKVSLAGTDYTLSLSNRTLRFIERSRKFWPRNWQRNPHYLLRIMQREIFGKKDSSLSGDIDRIQDIRMRYAVLRHRYGGKAAWLEIVRHSGIIGRHVGQIPEYSLLESDFLQRLAEAGRRVIGRKGVLGVYGEILREARVEDLAALPANVVVALGEVDMAGFFEESIINFVKGDPDMKIEDLLLLVKNVYKGFPGYGDINVWRDIFKKIEKSYYVRLYRSGAGDSYPPCAKGEVERMAVETAKGAIYNHLIIKYLAGSDRQLLTKHLSDFGDHLIWRSSSPGEDSLTTSMAGTRTSPRAETIAALAPLGKNQDEEDEIRLFPQDYKFATSSGIVFSDLGGRVTIETALGEGSTAVQAENNTIINVNRDTAEIEDIEYGFWGKPGHIVWKGIRINDRDFVSKLWRKFAVDVRTADGEIKKAPISAAQIDGLRRMALELESYLGFAVDVEWAARGEKLYIVQVRPATGDLRATKMPKYKKEDILAKVPTAIGSTGPAGFEGRIAIVNQIDCPSRRIFDLAVHGQGLMDIGLTPANTILGLDIYSYLTFNSKEFFIAYPNVIDLNRASRIAHPSIRLREAFRDNKIQAVADIPGLAEGAVPALEWEKLDVEIEPGVRIPVLVSKQKVKLVTNNFSGLLVKAGAREDENEKPAARRTHISGEEMNRYKRIVGSCITFLERKGAYYKTRIESLKQEIYLALIKSSESHVALSDKELWTIGMLAAGKYLRNRNRYKRIMRSLGYRETQLVTLDTVGGRIGILRHHYNLRQEDVAVKTGTGQSTVSQWEQNIAIPEPDKMNILAGMLNTTACYLLTGMDRETFMEIEVGYLEDPKARQLLGAKLRVLRYEAGLDQASLGAKAGVSRYVISNWETGKITAYKKDIDDLDSICRALGTTAEDALRRKSRELHGERPAVMMRGVNRDGWIHIFTGRKMCNVSKHLAGRILKVVPYEGTDWNSGVRAFDGEEEVYWEDTKEGAEWRLYEKVRVSYSGTLRWNGKDYDVGALLAAKWLYLRPFKGKDKNTGFRAYREGVEIKVYETGALEEGGGMGIYQLEMAAIAPGTTAEKLVDIVNAEEDRGFKRADTIDTVRKALSARPELHERLDGFNRLVVGSTKAQTSVPLSQCKEETVHILAALASGTHYTDKATSFFDHVTTAAMSLRNLKKYVMEDKKCLPYRDSISEIDGIFQAARRNVDEFTRSSRAAVKKGEVVENEALCWKEKAEGAHALLARSVDNVDRIRNGIAPLLSQDARGSLRSLEESLREGAETLKDRLDLIGGTTSAQSVNLTNDVINQFYEELILPSGVIVEGPPEEFLRLHFSISTPLAPMWVRGNKRSLVSLICNIAVNGFKKAANYKKGNGMVKITARPLSGQAVITIKDNGPGMTSEELEKLQRSFYTEGGTGIGLTVCRRILENHGGAMEIGSEPGKGTTVTIRLPLIDPPQGEKNQAVEPPPAEVEIERHSAADRCASARNEALKLCYTFPGPAEFTDAGRKVMVKLANDLTYGTDTSISSMKRKAHLRIASQTIDAMIGLMDELAETLNGGTRYERVSKKLRDRTRIAYIDRCWTLAEKAITSSRRNEFKAEHITQLLAVQDGLYSIQDMVEEAIDLLRAEEGGKGDVSKMGAPVLALPFANLADNWPWLGLAGLFVMGIIGFFIWSYRHEISNLFRPGERPQKKPAQDAQIQFTLSATNTAIEEFLRWLGQEFEKQGATLPLFTPEQLAGLAARIERSNYSVDDLKKYILIILKRKFGKNRWDEKTAQETIVAWISESVEVKGPKRRGDGPGNATPQGGGMSLNAIEMTAIAPGVTAEKLVEIVNAQGSAGLSRDDAIDIVRTAISARPDLSARLTEFNRLLGGALQVDASRPIITADTVRFMLEDGFLTRDEFEAVVSDPMFKRYGKSQHYKEILGKQYFEGRKEKEIGIRISSTTKTRWLELMAENSIIARKMMMLKACMNFVPAAHDLRRTALLRYGLAEYDQPMQVNEVARILEVSESFVYARYRDSMLPYLKALVLGDTETARQILMDYAKDLRPGKGWTQDEILRLSEEIGRIIYKFPKEARPKRKKARLRKIFSPLPMEVLVSLFDTYGYIDMWHRLPYTAAELKKAKMNFLLMSLNAPARLSAVIGEIRAKRCYEELLVFRQAVTNKTIMDMLPPELEREVETLCEEREEIYLFGHRFGLRIDERAYPRKDELHEMLVRETCANIVTMIADAVAGPDTSVRRGKDDELNSYEIAVNRFWELIESGGKYKERLKEAIEDLTYASYDYAVTLEKRTELIDKFRHSKIGKDIIGSLGVKMNMTEEGPIIRSAPQGGGMSLDAIKMKARQGASAQELARIVQAERDGGLDPQVSIDAIAKALSRDSARQAEFMRLVEGLSAIPKGERVSPSGTSPNAHSRKKYPLRSETLEKYEQPLRQAIAQYRAAHSSELPTQLEVGKMIGVDQSMVTLLIKAINAQRKEQEGFIPIKTRGRVGVKPKLTGEERVIEAYTRLIQTNRRVPSEVELAAELGTKQSNLTKRLAKINASRRKAGKPPILTVGMPETREMDAREEKQLILKEISKYQQEHRGTLPSRAQLAKILGIYRMSLAYKIFELNIDRLAKGEPLCGVGNYSWMPAASRNASLQIARNYAFFITMQEAVKYLDSYISRTLGKAATLEDLEAKIWFSSPGIVTRFLRASQNALNIYFRTDSFRQFLAIETGSRRQELTYCTGDALHISDYIMKQESAATADTLRLSGLLFEAMLVSVFGDCNFISDIYTAVFKDAVSAGRLPQLMTRRRPRRAEQGPAIGPISLAFVLMFWWPRLKAALENLWQRVSPSGTSPNTPAPHVLDIPDRQSARIVLYAAAGNKDKRTLEEIIDVFPNVKRIVYIDPDYAALAGIAESLVTGFLESAGLKIVGRSQHEGILGKRGKMKVFAEARSGKSLEIVFYSEDYYNFTPADMAEGADVNIVKYPGEGGLFSEDDRFYNKIIADTAMGGYIFVRHARLPSRTDEKGLELIIKTENSKAGKEYISGDDWAVYRKRIAAAEPVGKARVTYYVPGKKSVRTMVIDVGSGKSLKDILDCLRDDLPDVSSGAMDSDKVHVYVDGIEYSSMSIVHPGDDVMIMIDAADTKKAAPIPAALPAQQPSPEFMKVSARPINYYEPKKGLRVSISFNHTDEGAVKYDFEAAGALEFSEKLEGLLQPLGFDVDVKEAGRNCLIRRVYYDEAGARQGTTTIIFDPASTHDVRQAIARILSGPPPAAEDTPFLPFFSLGIVAWFVLGKWMPRLQNLSLVYKVTLGVAVASMLTVFGLLLQSPALIAAGAVACFAMAAQVPQDEGKPEGEKGVLGGNIPTSLEIIKNIPRDVSDEPKFQYVSCAYAHKIINQLYLEILVIANVLKKKKYPQALAEVLIQSYIIERLSIMGEEVREKFINNWPIPSLRDRRFVMISAIDKKEDRIRGVIRYIIEQGGTKPFANTAVELREFIDRHGDTIILSSVADLFNEENMAIFQYELINSVLLDTVFTEDYSFDESVRVLDLLPIELVCAIMKRLSKTIESAQDKKIRDISKEFTEKYIERKLSLFKRPLAEFYARLMPYASKVADPKQTHALIFIQTGTEGLLKIGKTVASGITACDIDDVGPLYLTRSIIKNESDEDIIKHMFDSGLLYFREIMLVDTGFRGTIIKKIKTLLSNRELLSKVSARYGFRIPHENYIVNGMVLASSSAAQQELENAGITAFDKEYAITTPGFNKFEIGELAIFLEDGMEHEFRTPDKLVKTEHGIFPQLERTSRQGALSICDAALQKLAKDIVPFENVPTDAELEELTAPAAPASSSANKQVNGGMASEDKPVAKSAEGVEISRRSHKALGREPTPEEFAIIWEAHLTQAEGETGNIGQPDKDGIYRNSTLSPDTMQMKYNILAESGLFTKPQIKRLFDYGACGKEEKSTPAVLARDTGGEFEKMLKPHLDVIRQVYEELSSYTQQPLSPKMITKAEMIDSQLVLIGKKLDIILNNPDYDAEKISGNRGILLHALAGDVVDRIGNVLNGISPVLSLAIKNNMSIQEALNVINAELNDADGIINGIKSIEEVRLTENSRHIYIPGVKNIEDFPMVMNSFTHEISKVRKDEPAAKTSPGSGPEETGLVAPAPEVEKDVPSGSVPTSLPTSRAKDFGELDNDRKPSLNVIEMRVRQEGERIFDTGLKYKRTESGKAVGKNYAYTGIVPFENSTNYSLPDFIEQIQNTENTPLSFDSNLSGANVLFLGPGTLASSIINLIKRYPDIAAVHLVDISWDVFYALDYRLNEYFGDRPHPKIYGYRENLLELPEEFSGMMDIVTDKCLFDTVKARPFDSGHIEQAEKEIERVLKPNGVHISIMPYAIQSHLSASSMRPLGKYDTVVKNNIDKDAGSRRETAYVFVKTKGVPKGNVPDVPAVAEPGRVSQNRTSAEVHRTSAEVTQTPERPPLGGMADVSTVARWIQEANAGSEEALASLIAQVQADADTPELRQQQIADIAGGLNEGVREKFLAAVQPKAAAQVGTAMAGMIAGLSEVVGNILDNNPTIIYLALFKEVEAVVTIPPGYYNLDRDVAKGIARKLLELMEQRSFRNEIIVLWPIGEARNLFENIWDQLHNALLVYFTKGHPLEGNEEALLGVLEEIMRDQRESVLRSYNEYVQPFNSDDYGRFISTCLNLTIAFKNAKTYELIHFADSVIGRHIKQDTDYELFYILVKFMKDIIELSRDSEKFARKKDQALKHLADYLRKKYPEMNAEAEAEMLINELTTPRAMAAQTPRGEGEPEGEKGVPERNVPDVISAKITWYGPGSAIYDGWRIAYEENRLSGKQEELAENVESLLNLIENEKGSLRGSIMLNLASGPAPLSHFNTPDVEVINIDDFPLSYQYSAGTELIYGNLLDLREITKNLKSEKSKPIRVTALCTNMLTQLKFYAPHHKRPDMSIDEYIRAILTNAWDALEDDNSYFIVTEPGCAEFLEWAGVFSDSLSDVIVIGDKSDYQGMKAIVFCKKAKKGAIPGIAAPAAADATPTGKVYPDRTSAEVLLPLHELVKSGLATNPISEGSEILISKNFFDPTDLIALRCVLDETFIKIVPPEEIQHRSSALGVTKDKVACIVSRDEFNRLWKGSNRHNNKATVIALDENDLKDMKYLYLEGLIGLVRAMMNNDREKIKAYMKLMFKVVADDKILDYLKNDNPVEFAINAVLRFKPIVAEDMAKIDDYKRAMEAYLRAA